MSKKGKRRKHRNQARHFAEQAPQRPSLGGEVGVAGDTFESGLPVDPYNPDLDGPEWFAKVDEMRRAGGQITAVEYVIGLPIRAAQWHVEGKSKDLADLVEHNLLDDNHDLSMSTTWDDVLRRACLAPLYGTWAMEKVWEEQDGQIVLRRLPDRLPRTIAEYQFGPDNSLTGVLQKATDREGQSVEVTLPIDRLLLFPYRKEGDNWNGLSLLRGAYLHWHIIQTMYRIANIGIERSLINVPVGELPPNSTDADKSTFLTLLMSYYQHESAAIVLEPGYKLQTGAAGGTQRVEFLDYVEHHAAWIMRAALADFAILGESARALGDVKIDFFLMAWEAFANELQAGFNRHLVRQLVAYNAPTAKGDDIPRIIHDPIGQLMRLKEAAEFLTAVFNGKFVVPDGTRADENVFRKLLGLPEVEERTAKQAGAVGAGLVPAPDDATPQGAGQSLRRGSGQAPGQPLPPASAADEPPPAEQPRQFAEADVEAAMARVAGDLRSSEDAWQREGELHLAAMLRSLLAQLDAAGGDPAAIARVAVPQPLVDTYAAWVAQWLDMVWETGAQTIEEEIGIATTAAAPAATHRARAALLAAHHAEAARFEVTSTALRGAGLDAIAARYAEVLDIRLRNDLTDEAQVIADELGSVADAGG